MKIEEDAFNRVFAISELIIRQVREDEDKFIFETLSPYLTDCYKMVIPKKLLVCAINAYKKEHKAEYEAIMEAYKENLND